MLYDKHDKIEKNCEIYRNYTYFCDLIQEQQEQGVSVSDIYRGIGLLTVAVIQLDNNDKAQEIFERINSTGIPLSLADKIRNYVLMTDIDQDRLYEEYWLKIEALLPREQLSLFFLDYLNMKIDGFAKESDAYDVFKEVYKNGGYSNETMLQEILHYVEYYHAFLYTSNSYCTEVNELLANLQRLKQTTVFLFLFKVFDDFNDGVIDENELVKVLRFLLHYSIRRMICEVGSNSLRGLYKTLYARVFANEDNKKHYYDAIVSFFMQLTSKDALVDDNTFVQALKYNNLYRKNALCKFLLVDIENQGKEKLEIEELSIEHIMPQNKNLSTSWQKMIGEDVWKEVQDKYLHTLGNLTLTGYNSEYGDLPFVEKKKKIDEFYTEADYEDSVVELFRDNMDYTYVYGPDIERDFESPLYEDILIESVHRINKGVHYDAIKEALLKLHNFDNGELVQKNAVFMDYLQNGIPVRYVEKGEEKSTIVYLVDYKDVTNNSFIVANQWTYIENSEKRPDVLLFLNGIPVVLIELKSPSREETDASEAYLQIRNYMQEIPSMFIYNVMCVMSDQLTSRAGTITSGEDRYMEWKTIDGNYENTQYAQFDTFFFGMFQKERLLDLIKNFTCFSNEGNNSYKILAGYHQYFAVRKAVESTRRATLTDGKGGVFWHTQGSGKSLSMVFYAHLLQEALDSPTIVVITDRNDLDDQLYGQFLKCKDFLRQEPVHATCRKLNENSTKNDIGLKDWLDGRKANGIIFTTMQKFEESIEPLSERRNIVVMADEAHRGQYGLDI